MHGQAALNTRRPIGPRNTDRALPERAPELPMARQPPDRGLALLALLFFLSGAVALVHEVAWIRKLTLIFGATAPAVSLVLAIFFAGMALGAWCVCRVWKGHPAAVRLYAGLEAAVGIWALLFPSLLSVTERLYGWLYPASAGHAGWLFVARATLVSFLLLPPSALMGATLPVLVRHFVRMRAHLGARIATLYALNTFGGALGALAAGFWLIRTLGVDGTIYAAGAGNLMLGGAAWLLASRANSFPVTASARGSVPSRSWRSRAWIGAAMAFGLSGFTGLAYEVVWTRYLSLFTVTSLYAYSTMLTVFLVGLAVGSLTAARWADRHPDLLARFGWLQIAVGISSLALFPSLVAVASSRIWFRLTDPLYSQLAVSAVLMIVPAALMGMAFPVLCKIVATEPDTASAIVGVVYALNTLGAILGSILAGFVLIPVFGMQLSVGLLASVNVAVGLAALACGPSLRWRRTALALAGTLAVVVLVRHVLPLDLPRARLQQYVGGAEQVLDVREGRMATAWVTEDAWGRRSLWGNSSVLGRTRRLYRMDLSAQRLQGHIPLVLHRGDPRTVLGIGFGTGQTFGAQLLYPIRRLDVVEISPEVVELALTYFGQHPDGVRSDPPAPVIIGDARSFVRVTHAHYDVISLEMPPHAEAGVVHFYTREFYALARERLAPHRALAQWLPIYNVTPEETRGIVRTFLAEFPESALWYNGANLLLLGFKGTFELSLRGVRERLQHPGIATDLAVSHLGGPNELLADPKYFVAGFLMGPVGLAALAKGGPVYTDNRPALEPTWRGVPAWGPGRG